MKIRRIPFAAALLALGGAWLLAPPSGAMSARPLSLADLVRESAQIVRGTVSAVSQGVDDSRIPYTEIQVKVSETIRGIPEETLTFRQFGLQSPQPPSGGRTHLGLVAGMPRYAAGDQVLLFLGPVSGIGLRTTVGLGQGRFALNGGNLHNDINNSGLFRGVAFGKRALSDPELSMVATKQGAVGAETFMSLVRRAVSEKWFDAPRPGIVRPGVPRTGPAAAQQITADGGLIND